MREMDEENDDDAFLAKYDSDGYGDEADRAQLMQIMVRSRRRVKRSAKLKSKIVSGF